MERSIGSNSQQTLARPADFERAVQAHLDGHASEAQMDLLHEHRPYWVANLYRLLDQAEDSMEQYRRRLAGSERDLVVADYERELARIDAVLTELVGPAVAEPDAPVAQEVAPVAATKDGDPQLQLSWAPGQIIAWSGAIDAVSLDETDVEEMLVAAGASGIEWESHERIKLPDGSTAAALSTPIQNALGWMASLTRLIDDETVGLSVPWLGMTTGLAVRMVGAGRFVPSLKKGKKAKNSGGGDLAAFEVRWIPTLIEASELANLVESLPGCIGALEKRDPRALTQAVIADVVNAVCSSAAERLEVPAAPPDPRSKVDVAEAFLARLDGVPFVAPSGIGFELSRRLDQWARPVSGVAKFRLVIQLDPPDSDNAWYLQVLAPGTESALEPVEKALVNASNNRRKEVQDQLVRLERLFPELLRSGGRRRGEVVLSQDEAWDLMTVKGNTLTAVGYDVRVPALSRKKPTPGLRLTAEEAQKSVVGAQQLANVSWSATFDDVELTAAEIARLAAQAKPLIRSHGKWVELDHADLAEAAAALAERADQTRLTGADMLRQALGLDGSSLAGGISLAGDGWASELLESARSIPKDPTRSPDGFVGELRSYQAEAHAWLSFLDRAGLGGCLALDMGLGKTPTMLAHLGANSGSGPSLVIAPPAVVGNWASEAAKFAPGLNTVVHHGPSRVDEAHIPSTFRTADLVITTYGTAVRDVEGLGNVEWARVILDEAQAIKNATSETARQLRLIPARSRIALTGTPIENGLGDLWAIMDFTNPGLVGPRNAFVSQLSAKSGVGSAAEGALRALNGILVFRRTKAEPAIAAELPDRIDELDLCSMTSEQIGLYQAVLDNLVVATESGDSSNNKGAVLAAITALKQICNHPAAYEDDDQPLDGRSGKLERLNEIIDTVFAAGERILIFTHFAKWGNKLSAYISERTGVDVACYHGGLSRGARDTLVDEFQKGTGAGAMVLSLKAGGTGLNLTAASHVVLYDRWWNPAVEDQARDRVWRIGQTSTVVCHRLVCPGTVDERVEEVVAGKRQIADLVLPRSSSIGDLDSNQLRAALGIDEDQLLTVEAEDVVSATATDSDTGTDATPAETDAAGPLVGNPT